MQKNIHGTKYVRGVTEALWIQVHFRGEGDDMYCSKHRNKFLTGTPPSTTTVYIRTCYEELTDVVQQAPNGGNLRIENDEGNAELSVRCF